jgi:hypothetical protein
MAHSEENCWVKSDNDKIHTCCFKVVSIDSHGKADNFLMEMDAHFDE